MMETALHTSKMLKQTQSTVIRQVIMKCSMSQDRDKIRVPKGKQNCSQRSQVKGDAELVLTVSLTGGDKPLGMFMRDCVD